jgi:hypothetical protein
MLHAWRHPKTGELRLYVRGVPTEAWISTNAPHGSLRGADWALFVRSGSTATAEKCPTRLAVESCLRAWFLSRYGRPLLTLRFHDLAKIARGEIG